MRCRSASNDKSGAKLPAQQTLTNGSGSGSVTLKNNVASELLVTLTVTVTDSNGDILTGSADVVVAAAGSN